MQAENSALGKMIADGAGSFPHAANTDKTTVATIAATQHSTSEAKLAAPTIAAHPSPANTTSNNHRSAPRCDMRSSDQLLPITEIAIAAAQVRCSGSVSSQPSPLGIARAAAPTAIMPTSAHNPGVDRCLDLAWDESNTTDTSMGRTIIFHASAGQIENQSGESTRIETLTHHPKAISIADQSNVVLPSSHRFASRQAMKPQTAVITKGTMIQSVVVDISKSSSSFFGSVFERSVSLPPPRHRWQYAQAQTDPRRFIDSIAILACSCSLSQRRTRLSCVSCSSEVFVFRSPIRCKNKSELPTICLSRSTLKTARIDGRGTIATLRWRV